MQADKVQKWRFKPPVCSRLIWHCRTKTCCHRRLRLAEVLVERRKTLVPLISLLTVVVTGNAENDSLESRCDLQPGFVRSVELVRVGAFLSRPVDDIAKISQECRTGSRVLDIDIFGHR